MDTNKILSSDYLDIVFDGRNKKYGGYELRKTYAHRMRNAAIVGIGAMILSVVGPAIASVMPSKTVVKPVVITPIDLVEPPSIDPKIVPPPPLPPTPPPPVRPTTQFTPPIVSKDRDVQEDQKPPEQADLHDVSVGLKTETGDPNGIDGPRPDVTGTGTGPITAATTTKSSIPIYVEQMPVSSVDVNEYMGKHIHYPEAAKEGEIAGKVILRFVVNEDGSLSNITVARGIGGGCDEEAMRVLASMPNWKPGRQNGRAVKVYFTLPIIFKLQ